MASIINAKTSSGGGIDHIADSSGNLTLQGAGNTGITISSLGIPTLPNGMEWPDGFTQSLSGDKKLAADQTFTAQSSVSFTGIPTSIQSARIKFSITVGTNNVQFYMRAYDGTGSVKSGSTDYQVTNFNWATNGGSGVSSSGNSSVFILTPGNVSSNTSWGVKGVVDMFNMQSYGSAYPLGNYGGIYLDQTGNYAVGHRGCGACHWTNGITGFQFFASSGTISGKISLEGLAG